MWRIILSAPLLFVAILAIVEFGNASSASAADNFRALSKEEIKETPILERPYHRPGHFYGNTVRRRYANGTARGYDMEGNPQTRVAVWFERRM